MGGGGFVGGEGGRSKLLASVHLAVTVLGSAASGPPGAVLRGGSAPRRPPKSVLQASAGPLCGQVRVVGSVHVLLCPCSAPRLSGRVSSGPPALRAAAVARAAPARAAIAGRP